MTMKRKEKTFATNESFNFDVWFDHVCILFALLAASILSRGGLGRREVEEQIIQRSWEGHAELAIVCIVDLES